MLFKAVTSSELEEMAQSARLKIVSQAMLDAGVDALGGFNLEYDPYEAVVCDIFEAMQAADDSDGYTVTSVPGGARVCLVVTVPFPEGPLPDQEASAERRAEALRRIKAEIPALLPTFGLPHNPL